MYVHRFPQKELIFVIVLWQDHTGQIIRHDFCKTEILQYHYAEKGN